MHKLTLLLSGLLAAMLLASLTGSVDIKTGDQSPALQGICRAPSSWLNSVLDGFREEWHVPALLGRQEQSLEDMVPNITSAIHSLPVGKGSALEGWILKTSPRYL